MLEEESLSQGGESWDEVHHPVRVAPLVVVPGDGLRIAVSGRGGRERVEYRRVRVADDVGGNERQLAVLDDSLHRPFCRRFDRGIDLRGGGRLCETASQIHDRAV